MVEERIITDKFRFDEHQLQVGDIIQKPNGTKYIVVEQDIDIFCIRHLFRSSELKQVVKTYMKEVKELVNLQVKE